MKAIFYSPYLHILGGGEQHLLSMAKCFSKDYQIYFVSPDLKLVKSGLKRFQIKLDSFQTVPVFPARIQLRRFDLIVFVSNGSVPFLPLSKSILYFMSPFTKVNGRSLINQLKLKTINHVIVNSMYAKKHIDKEFSTQAKVIYPAINSHATNVSKKNIILSIGRFTPSLHQKKQQTLIKAFIQLKDKLPGWRLILAGGTESGSQQILTNLKHLAKNHPISIKTNVTKSTLNKLYSQAKIYWHATGFNEDLKLKPQRAEHFGIAIVEAMIQGAVPLVFNAGGPKEIITKESGFCWDTLDQLKTQTLDLVNHPKKLNTLALKAKARAKYFNSSKLCKTLYEMVKN